MDETKLDNGSAAANEDMDKAAGTSCLFKKGSR